MVKKSKILYPARLAARLVRLPRYIAHFEARDKYITNNIEDIHRQLKQLSDKQAGINDATTELQHQLVRKQLTRSTVSGEQINNTVSDNHEFDYFYKLFEDKFRGSEAVIRERIAEHIPLFVKLPKAIKRKPVVDIGCGRGEFLGLMQDKGFNVVGIDMNDEMIDRAKTLGYKAILTDAFSYLHMQKDSSLAGVTGFHIVEHIPFESLMKIFSEAHRTISKGGFALFETPNPETLSVGANTFYLDPSHQRPIPPGLLSFMLESVGFDTSVVYMRRIKPKVSYKNKIQQDIYDSLFGPADYAVIATKK